MWIDKQTDIRVVKYIDIHINRYTYIDKIKIKSEVFSQSFPFKWRKTD